MIYLIAFKRYGRFEAVTGALLFLFSFQALRFGGRFYLDQYGAFFFLLSLYFLFDDKPFIAGVFGVAAILAREYWLAVYPFTGIYLSPGYRASFRFFAPLGISVLILLPFLLLDGELNAALKMYLLNGSLLKNLSASVFGHGSDYFARVLRGWLEFSALNLVILTGALAVVLKESKLLFFILPQVFAISLMHGFVVDGGVTQYTLPLAAVMSIFAGEGLRRIRDKYLAFIGNGVFQKAVISVIALQFIAFNAFATAVSRHNNPTVYGLGFWDDREVISLLNKKAGDKVINGIHGAFVEGRARWDWTDYLVQEAIEKDPDWLVTFHDYVEVIPQENPATAPEIYRIGPYIVIEAPSGGRLADHIRQRGIKKWALSGAP